MAAMAPRRRRAPLSPNADPQCATGGRRVRQCGGGGGKERFSMKEKERDKHRRTEEQRARFDRELQQLRPVSSATRRASGGVAVCGTRASLITLIDTD